MLETETVCWNDSSRFTVALIVGNKYSSSYKVVLGHYSLSKSRIYGFGGFFYFLSELPPIPVYDGNKHSLVLT